MTAVMALFLATGLVLPAMLLFPAPIAYCWIGRRDTLAWGLLLCATVTPVLMLGSVLVGLVFGLVAAQGLVLGVLVRNRMSFGGAILVLTLIVFVFMAAHSAIMWDTLRADWQAALQMHSERFESSADEEPAPHVVSMLAWFEENLAYVYFGMLASGILLLVTALCSAIYWTMRLEAPVLGGNYKFMTMRTPEHLVWLAILLALLWFLDSRWPNEVVRFLSWNGALVLATVYWINGLSILLYVFHVLKFKPFVPYIVLLGMVLLNLVYVLSIAGFFDTWLDFRRKASEYVMTRTQKDNDASDK